MELTWLRNALLKIAKPYSSLYHADGSLYMERFHVMERRGNLGSIRLHHICTEDRDDAMHDHPFSFYTLILTGGYLEARPEQRDPCFSFDGRELAVATWRRPGSVAYRHACDRHKITYVKQDTWTLVFAGPLRQWWGFYTPIGKIFWREYETKHSTNARSEK